MKWMIIRLSLAAAASIFLVLAAKAPLLAWAGEVGGSLIGSAAVLVVGGCVLFGVPRFLFRMPTLPIGTAEDDQ